MPLAEARRAGDDPLAAGPPSADAARHRLRLLAGVGAGRRPRFPIEVLLVPDHSAPDLPRPGRRLPRRPGRAAGRRAGPLRPALRRSRCRTCCGSISGRRTGTTGRCGSTSTSCRRCGPRARDGTSRPASWAPASTSTRSIPSTWPPACAAPHPPTTARRSGATRRHPEQEEPMPATDQLLSPSSSASTTRTASSSSAGCSTDDDDRRAAGRGGAVPAQPGLRRGGEPDAPRVDAAVPSLRAGAPHLHSRAGRWRWSCSCSGRTCASPTTSS